MKPSENNSKEQIIKDSRVGSQLSSEGHLPERGELGLALRRLGGGREVGSILGKGTAFAKALRLKKCGGGGMQHGD